MAGYPIAFLRLPPRAIGPSQFFLRTDFGWGSLALRIDSYSVPNTPCEIRLALTVAELASRLTRCNWAPAGALSDLTSSQIHGLHLGTGVDFVLLRLGQIQALFLAETFACDRQPTSAFAGARLSKSPGIYKIRLEPTGAQLASPRAWNS